MYSGNKLVDFLWLDKNFKISVECLFSNMKIIHKLYKTNNRWEKCFQNKK